MSITVVTEGDFAGIEKKVSFTITPENCNLFSVILPLSLLLDSFHDKDKENQCIEKLKGEFLYLPTGKARTDAANRAYTILKKAALKQDVQPTFPVTSEDLKHIEDGIDSCPPWVSACARVSNMKVCITGDNSELMKEKDGTTYSGLSTGNLVYVNWMY